MHLIITQTKYRRVVYFCLSVLLTFTSVQAETKQQGVLLIPFKINDTAKHPLLTQMISDMLFSRLSSIRCMSVMDYRKLVDKIDSVDEKTAQGFVEEHHLSHFIMGSVSIFGGHYSIDTQLWKNNDTKPFFTYAGLAASENDVIPKIHEMSMALQDALCQKNVYQQAPNDQSKKGGFSFKAFPPLDMEIQAMTVADVNQDKYADVIVSDKNTIYLFDIRDDHLAIIGQYETNHAYQIIGMDAADLDHDQHPEIFVTAKNKLTGGLVSFVLAWEANQLSVVLQDEPFYFRCFQRADHSVQLIGQKQSVDKFFSKKVFLLNYAHKKLFIEKPQAIPPNTHFASFHQGRFTGRYKDYVIVRSDNKIEILDAALRQKWLSEILYAESKNILILPKKQSQRSSHDKEKYCYLNQRIQVFDVDHDNLDEIIVSEHHATSGGRLFQRYRQFQSGTITCLKWNGLGMIPLWKTPKINGYISDYIWFDKTGNGNMCIAVACVSTQVSMFKPVQTTLFLFDYNE
ncbi:MAG: VCBS repeat-containing protein [Candidatus Magnetomorum sp.]|nr:VCBS repeat-containing protein [Candidatus Magnetomorum sp.]